MRRSRWPWASWSLPAPWRSTPGTRSSTRCSSPLREPEPSCHRPRVRHSQAQPRPGRSSLRCGRWLSRRRPAASPRRQPDAAAAHGMATSVAPPAVRRPGAAGLDGQAMTALRGVAIPPFFAGHIGEQAAQRARHGLEVIPMHFGQPSEGASPAALDAARAHLDGRVEGPAGYWESAPLRERIALHYRERVRRRRRARAHPADDRRERRAGRDVHDALRRRRPRRARPPRLSGVPQCPARARTGSGRDRLRAGARLSPDAGAAAAGERALARPAGRQPGQPDRQRARRGRTRRARRRMPAPRHPPRSRTRSTTASPTTGRS